MVTSPILLNLQTIDHPNGLKISKMVKEILKLLRSCSWKKDSGKKEAEKENMLIEQEESNFSEIPILPLCLNPEKRNTLVFKSGAEEKEISGLSSGG